MKLFSVYQEIKIYISNFKILNDIGDMES